LKEKWEDWMIEGDGIVVSAAESHPENWSPNSSRILTKTFQFKLQGMNG
jgi:hypothetical protein